MGTMNKHINTHSATPSMILCHLISSSNVISINPNLYFQKRYKFNAFHTGYLIPSQPHPPPLQLLPILLPKLNIPLPL